MGTIVVARNEAADRLAALFEIILELPSQLGAGEGFADVEVGVDDSGVLVVVLVVVLQPFVECWEFVIGGRPVVEARCGELLFSFGYDDGDFVSWEGDVEGQVGFTVLHGLLVLHGVLVQQGLLGGCICGWFLRHRKSGRLGALVGSVEDVSSALVIVDESVTNACLILDKGYESRGACL